MLLPTYNSTNDRKKQSKKDLELTALMNENETFTKQATEANIVIFWSVAHDP